MTLPSVAVVILNYNGRQHLENFLPSVLASTYGNLRVVVADNASTDDSLVFLREAYPSVEVLTHPRNEGFAGGYNWALKRVTADYYVLLNSDVQVTPGWIEPLITLMEADARIAAAQPKLLSYREPELFEYAGAAGGWIDHLGYPFSRGRIFDVCETDTHQYDTAEPIFWASGAAMFVKAAVYHELGGLDDSFFAHQEEIDLCWRMQLAGYRIWSCPQSVVYHVGAGTLPRGGRKVFLNFRNNLLMLCKNLPWQEKVWKLPFRIGLDALSAWKGLFTGDIYFFTAIAKAHLAVMGRMVTGGVQKSDSRKPMRSLDGVYGGSVVWQYFIKQHTRFREIIQKKAF
ncbi:MAG: glycosyltransferase family 2 protein [Chitinophagaceae bacterium]|nr:glycosyltransferase family 2 protein [Chitinophagaceae bacterium]MCA6454526.1 glycosyltransferase family 2 protein [Chitinophagaceae bacterium]MCA6457678.1 glycosyltransferase family 2 protein [Chitinophagaceae bacterium]MCA6463391.1 glycosyltransferase family 2 protein [Chitinophagaceae bacterium]